MAKISGAARGKAAEREYSDAARIKEDISTKKKAEITAIRKLFDFLDKIVRDRQNQIIYSTPKDIPQDKLPQFAQKMFTAVSRINKEISALLRGELSEIKELKHIFIKTGRIGSLKRRERKIKSELNAIEKYWRFIAEKGRLPNWRNPILNAYNRQKISFPFTYLQAEDIKALEQISKVFRKSSYFK